MYRQILIHEKDRDYQRILWRFLTNESVQEFRLNTVTYGLACAPFLAIRCVRQLASSASDQFRQASHVLLNDLYVDDILTGVNCRSDAINLISQLRGCRSRGRTPTGRRPHFNITKSVGTLSTLIVMLPTVLSRVERHMAHILKRAM